MLAVSFFYKPLHTYSSSKSLILKSAKSYRDISN